MASYQYTITLQSTGQTGQTVDGVVGTAIKEAFEDEPSILIYQIYSGWSGKSTGTIPFYPLVGVVITFIQSTSPGVNKPDLDVIALNIADALQVVFAAQAITLTNQNVELQPLT